MEAANIPVKMPIVWGQDAAPGNIRVVPISSQIGINAGYASFTDGFVPLNFINPNAGGVPPWGQDFNGIFNAVTSWLQWEQAGAQVNFDATFSTAVGGYPQYAMVSSLLVPGAWWQSQVDNNTNNPDTGGSNWILCTMAQPYLDARYLRFPPATSFYINSAVGSDTLYDGTSPTIVAGTSHGPWASPLHAFNFLSTSFAYTGIIRLYMSGNTYPNINFSASSIGSWSIIGAGAVGNPYTTGTTIVSSTAPGGRGLISYGVTVTAQNITATAYFECFAVTAGGQLVLFNCSVVGVGTTSAGFSSNTSGSLIMYQNTATGTTNNVTYHASGTFGSIISTSSATVNIGYFDGVTTCNVVFTFGVTTASVVVVAQETGAIFFTIGHVTFAGSIPTGQRFNVSYGGGVSCASGGVNFIPGTVAGVASTSTTITLATGYVGGWYQA